MWRKSGANHLLSLAKIKQFQGLAVLINTSRPCQGQREWGASQAWELKRSNDLVFKAYRKEYKKRFARIKAGKLTQEEFSAWSERAREKRSECDEGVLTLKEFERWLKES